MSSKPKGKNNIDLLSVIVPVYKQEKTIIPDLLRIAHTLLRTPYKFEIIAVVDGTTLDNSYSKIKKIKNNHIFAYGYPTNKGKGQAVRYGMKKAKGNIISFIDSGMDIDPSGIMMMIEHMKWYDADIIVASKLHSASYIKNYPPLRKILTYGYYLFVKLLFGLKIRDTQTGLKAFNRAVLEKVLDRMVIKRFAFDIEILAVANRLGYRKIFDCPVRIDFSPYIYNTSVAGKKLLRSIMSFLYDTFGVAYRMYILKYYDDGQQRKRTYDKELDMWVNTGAMTGNQQILIRIVDGIFSGLVRIFS